MVSALSSEMVIEGAVEVEEASKDLKARFAEKFRLGKPRRIELLVNQSLSHTRCLGTHEEVKSDNSYK